MRAPSTSTRIAPWSINAGKRAQTFHPSMTQKVLVALDMEEVPHGFTFLQGRAAELVPVLAAKWLSEAQTAS
jgi:hypothetical protein